MSKKNANVKIIIIKLGTEAVKRIKTLTAKRKKGFWARLFKK